MKNMLPSLLLLVACGLESDGERPELAMDHGYLRVQGEWDQGPAEYEFEENEPSCSVTYSDLTFLVVRSPLTSTPTVPAAPPTAIFVSMDKWLGVGHFEDTPNLDDQLNADIFLENRRMGVWNRPEERHLELTEFSDNWVSGTFLFWNLCAETTVHRSPCANSDGDGYCDTEERPQCTGSATATFACRPEVGYD